MYIQKRLYLIGLVMLICGTQQTFSMFSRLMSRMARPGLRSLTVNSPLRNPSLIRAALRTSTQQTPLSCNGCDRSAQRLTHELQCGQYETTALSTLSIPSENQNALSLSFNNLPGANFQTMLDPSDARRVFSTKDSKGSTAKAVALAIVGASILLAAQSQEDEKVQKVPVKTKDPKKVTVLGTGYVGLVTGPGLADIGHQVIGADIDASKIEALHNGIVPIYEPGLKELIDRNVQEGRLSFTSDIPAAIRASDIIFIAVGTPMSDDGSADLSYVEAAAKTISENLNDFKVIVIKSTVPVGTGMKIKALIEKNPKNIGKFAMVSNPEFLREGVAIKDFMHGDRIVVGSSSEKAARMMRELYSPLTDAGAALLETNVPSAEMTKYASNAMLAVKISFANEMSQFADVVGADIRDVTNGMGLDRRINPYFLQPGPGFGGSCFPKDSNALVYMGKQHGLNLKSVQASLDVNADQRKKVIEKLVTLEPNLQGKTVGILGLAFKANTDDIRVAPALDIIKYLMQQGATVKAYDPAAMENTKKLYPAVAYTNDAYEAITGADAVVVLTEWDEFKKLDVSKMAVLMKHKVIVDARNLYDPVVLKQLGFVGDNMGCSYLWR